MGLSSIYNSIKGGINKAGNSLSSMFESKPVTYYNRSQQAQSPVQQAPTPQYNIPPVISKEHHSTFIEQAKLAGITPDEFGEIALREQGPGVLPHQARMTGWMDPTDKGVMQINKKNDKLIREKFLEEFGEEYDSNNTRHSIIGARMVLQEHRRQFEQMRVNKSFMGDFSGPDLVDTYNTGVSGWIKAKAGDPERQKRLLRYQNAGQ